MRYQHKIADDGKTRYKLPVAEGPQDLPIFKTFADKEQVIITAKELYAEGRLIRGSRQLQMADNRMGHCILGVIDELLHLDVFYPSWDIGELLAFTNNEGPSGYDAGKPVTPAAFENLMKLLHQCEVK